jgi:hypothetical protein
VGTNLAWRSCQSGWAGCRCPLGLGKTNHGTTISVAVPPTMEAIVLLGRCSCRTSRRGGSSFCCPKRQRASLHRAVKQQRRFSSLSGGGLARDAADASAREVVWSGPLAMPPSSVLDQLGQFLPRVEHAGLHRCGRNTEYLRALINRLLVVVSEFDDFPMFQR